MELSSFPAPLYTLEDLLAAPTKENWSTLFSTTAAAAETATFFPNGYEWISTYGGFDDQYPDFLPPSLLDLLTLPHDSPSSSQIFANACAPLDHHEYPTTLVDANNGGLFGGQMIINGASEGCFCGKVKVEEQNSKNVVVGGVFDEKLKVNSKAKKVEGQPSKNLMAERRRRKRLNDRLSMLRSIVPKISKMDRTSILGDTIDYMKELLDKINQLRQNTNNNNMEEDDNKCHMKNLNPNSCKQLKTNEAIVRNPPKFEVERRNVDTRIEICCATKQGLLLSTVSTLEALGLDIHQCVISCFNDFSFQASCSEEATEHRTVVRPEDVKQALFKTAGYGGRCL